MDVEDMQTEVLVEEYNKITRELMCRDYKDLKCIEVN